MTNSPGYITRLQFGAPLPPGERVQPGQDEEAHGQLRQDGEGAADGGGGRGTEENCGRLETAKLNYINGNSKALFPRFGELLQRSNLGGDPRLQAEDGLHRVPALGHGRQIPLRAPHKVNCQK